MVERREISRHEVEVFRVLLVHEGQWLSNAEITAEAEAVAQRTVRAMTLKFVRLGILDQAEVFPSHRYRLSPRAMDRNRGYFERIHRAAEALGVVLP